MEIPKNPQVGRYAYLDFEAGISPFNISLNPGHIKCQLNEGNFLLLGGR